MRNQKRSVVLQHIANDDLRPRCEYLFVFSEIAPLVKSRRQTHVSAFFQLFLGIFFWLLACALMFPTQKIQLKKFSWMTWIFPVFHRCHLSNLFHAATVNQLLCTTGHGLRQAATAQCC